MVATGFLSKEHWGRGAKRTASNEVSVLSSGKVPVYEVPTSSKEVVDLSPPQALERAEHFLVGQGYVVVRRTATTLTVVRKNSASATGQESRPKVVVMAVPQPEGGVRIKVKGDDREGVQERRGLWKLWAENLPKRQR